MRQRRLKDLEQRWEQFGHRIIPDGSQYRGQWREYLQLPASGPLYLELGCGKGQFIITQAQAHPRAGFIAIEGQPSVAVIAAQHFEEAKLDNAVLICAFVQHLEDYFAEGELDGIYLNFSDPWPKARHAKRRLTHHEYLRSYQYVVRSGGTVEFKSDNDGLYAFTLDEIHCCGLTVLDQTSDLHHSAYAAANVSTEYEEKFSSQGKCIHYIKFKVK